MTNFFKKLPTISYFGVPAKNLLALAKLSDDTLNNRTLFYPYTLTESDRIDTISDDYYENPDFTWLIFLTNNIVDPYHDVYLNDRDFERYVEKKYNSTANAQQSIAYYSNDWSIDESELTIAEYNALGVHQKKYFSPVVDQYNNIYQYQRNKEDRSVSTNKTAALTLSNASGTFTIGEKVTQRYANNGYAANGYVTFSNSTAMSVQHITGNFIASNTSVILTVRGVSSNATANATVANTFNNIPENELVYWTSVSYYDHEVMENNKKKEIYLLDNRYSGTAEAELKRAMK